MKLKLFLLAGAALLPTLAQAQTYNRIITFGDSLSDNGNLFAVSGQPPAPYFQGRFSNGPVFVEYLNGPMLTAGPTILGAPPGPAGLPANANLNFAFGGARTDTLVAVPPGTATQINNYIAGGGQFRSTDFVTLWAGANDLLQAFPGAAANPLTAAATMQGVAVTAATNVGTQVGTIASRGAGTIVSFNLPDLGQAPAFTAQGPQAVQLASFSSLAFNNALNQATRTAATAFPTTNVIQIPVDRLFATVVASPASFGFTNVTQQCIMTPACVGGTAATQNGYLFWDGVHPTTAGHRLLSAYVSEFVFAPVRAAAVASVATVGFWSRRQSMSDMMERLDGANPKGPNTEFFVSIIGETGRRDVSVSGGFAGGAAIASPFGSVRYEAAGFRIGGFKRLNDAWLVGGALSATTGEAKAGTLTFKPTTFSADVVGRWKQGPTFINMGLGAQVTDYRDIERTSLIAALTSKGSTTGYGGSAVVEAGYRAEFGAYALVPKARVGYIVSHMQGFDETGGAAPVAFRGRSLGGFVAGAELRAEANLGSAVLHGVVGYETLFGRTGDRLTGRLRENTALPFSVKGIDPVGAGLLLGAGVDANFGTWKAGLAYRASIGTKSQVTHRGQVSLSTAF